MSTTARPRESRCASSPVPPRRASRNRSTWWRPCGGGAGPRAGKGKGGCGGNGMRKPAAQRVDNRQAERRTSGSVDCVVVPGRGQGEGVAKRRRVELKTTRLRASYARARSGTGPVTPDLGRRPAFQPAACQTGGREGVAPRRHETQTRRRRRLPGGCQPPAVGRSHSTRSVGGFQPQARPARRNRRGRREEAVCGSGNDSTAAKFTPSNWVGRPSEIKLINQ